MDESPAPHHEVAEFLLEMSQVQDQAASDSLPRVAPVAPIAPAPAPARVAQCCRRGCKSTTTLFKCRNEGCNKVMHYACYQGSVLVKHALAPLPLQGYAIACTKRCYSKIIKEVKKKQQSGNAERLLWHQDGKDGPDDPKTSQAILVDWLTTPGNYSKYRGTNNHGKKKIHFA